MGSLARPLYETKEDRLLSTIIPGYVRPTKMRSPVQSE